MSVSKRFVWLLPVAALLVLLAWPLGLHSYMFTVCNLLLAGLWAVDYWLSPKPGVFTVSRDANDKLYFKTDNVISFRLRNHSPHPLRVQARDEIVDQHFTIKGEDLTHTIKPGEEKIFSYTVVPAKRGSFLFPHIYIRFTGVLGLCVKYTQIPCPLDCKVYPNLRDLSKYRLMIQKNRFLPQGEKTLRLYGAGAEFKDLRPYVDGDDYRKINWMATARENRLIVNNYQLEKNQPVVVMVDAGRPMSYTVKGYKKLDYAINAALILSDIVNQQGDNSGLLVFDNAVRTFISPGKGETHRNGLMEALYHVADTRQTSDYESAFRALCERQSRRSLVFLFTDFEILEEAEELIAHIALLKRKHMPIVVFMKNESLNALAAQPVYSTKDEYLRSTAESFITERKQIFKTLNAMRIPNVESAAEAFATAAVNRYIALSAQQIY